MINVLHLRDTHDVGGPGKTIIETACRTDRAAFDQIIAIYRIAGEPPSPFGESARARGCEVIEAPSSHPYDPRIALTIRDIVRQRHIDLVHSHDYRSDLITWALRRLIRVPVMTTVHGWITNSAKSRAMVGLSQKAIRSFDCVVAVSEGTKRRILNCGVAADRVAVIHNAIVTEDYDPAKQTPGYLRQRFNLPTGAVIVGSVGRLSPEKGQYDLLEAARRVAPVRPQVYFVFTGDGPDEAGLRARVSEYGLADRVLFTGKMKDARPVFRDLDILALTSHTEGFPNVVLEALCMETPVVATDVGGTGEIIVDEVTGVLIPPRQPDRIEAGLLGLIDDPARAARLMRAGRQAVFERFSFSQRVSREEALYREILARATAPRASGGLRP
jgi:glycosyltransferase involved in cell wall biosynthesis